MILTIVLKVMAVCVIIVCRGNRKIATFSPDESLQRKS